MAYNWFLEVKIAKERMGGWRFLLRRELENAIHILLKCQETKIRRYQFLSAKFLKIRE